MASPTPAYEMATTPLEDEGKPDPYMKPKPTTLLGKLKEFYLSVFGVILGALLGIAIGWALQTTNPSTVVTSWVGILGHLFIRAIKCLVAPLVFCSLVVGMSDMLAVGKAGKIGSRAFMMYVITTVCATIEGLICVIIFRPLFGGKGEPAADATPEFAFGCGEPGFYLTNEDGELSCQFDATMNETGSFSNSTRFMVTDINGYFAEADSEFVDRSLTDALQGQLDALVPDNVTVAFADASLLSIIMFAIPFGIAISLLPPDMTLVTHFFREINSVFMRMIGWVIVCTPIALVSLLAETVAVQTDLGILVTDVGSFVLCSIIGMLFHISVVFPCLLRAFVPMNPFAYMRHLIPAQVFALSCASSMATLPVTMKCVDSTKQVSKTLSRFVLSLGATVNMDGSAICYPIAIVFMAEAEGLGHLIGNVEYFLIILVATLGAIGAGPVPAASIVMVMTIWNSVFPNVALPSTFAFIVATDWLLDRFATCTNVTGDSVISRIIAELVDENTLDDEERESLASAFGRVSRAASEKGAV